MRALCDEGRTLADNLQRFFEGKFTQAKPLDVRAANGHILRFVLWDNAGVQEIRAQEVAVDLSGYEHVLVEMCYRYPTDDVPESTVPSLVGRFGLSLFQTNPNGGRELVRVDSTRRSVVERQWWKTVTSYLGPSR